jgi:hypothetical protein
VKKIIIISLLIWLSLIGFGCQKQEKSEADQIKSKYDRVDDFESVIITVDEISITKSGLTLKIYNNRDEAIGYSTFYCVEKIISGEWYKIPQLPDKVSWPFIGYDLEPSHTAEFDIDWVWLYGELDPGNYRIIKYFDAESNPDKKYYLSAEFEIALR